MLNFQRKLQSVSEIYKVFEEKEISPILIKGLSAALYYPKAHQRNFSDVDLAVDSKDFEAARKLIRENNFNVDLHRELRHLDTVEWSDLFENSVIEKIGDTEIRTLRPEDHLRVLCTHWLTDGGADRTRLWDIYFLLKKYDKSFDWRRFLDLVDDKRRRWLLTVLAIAEEYLGMDLNLGVLPYKYNEDLNLYGWINSEIEKEWGSDTRLVPLHITINGKNDLLEQLKKRFPPNVLQAIVETESDLREDFYYFLRVKGFYVRTKKSVQHLISVWKGREI